jgi:hypothetical protein
VSQPGSLPAKPPRGLARRPYLAAALLRWRNTWHLRRSRLLLATALGAALVLAALAAPPTGRALQWLARSPVITFAISACLFGLSAVRRRERIQADVRDSWLAALPVPPSSLPRLLLGAAARLGGATVFLGLATAAGSATTAMAWQLLIATAAGAVAGTLAGARLGGRGAAGLTAWHYARVRRARPRWATSPSLMPLGFWPVAQGRAFSRPSASRVVLFALLAVPAGRRDPGEVALAVAAACVTAFTLVSLSTAAVRAADDAARWLAPTTVRLRAFIAAFIWGVVVKEAAVLAVVIFLACAVDDRQALHVGLPLAAAYLALSSLAIAAACARAGRHAGLGAGRSR